MAPLDPNLASEPPASSETCRTRERRDHGSTCEQPGPDVGCWTLSLVRRTGSSNVAIILERSHSRYTHRGTLEHAGLSEARREGPLGLGGSPARRTALSLRLITCSSTHRAFSPKSGEAETMRKSTPLTWM